MRNFCLLNGLFVLVFRFCFWRLIRNFFYLFLKYSTFWVRCYRKVIQAKAVVGEGYSRVWDFWIQTRIPNYQSSILQLKVTQRFQFSRIFFNLCKSFQVVFCKTRTDFIRRKLRQNEHNRILTFVVHKNQIEFLSVSKYLRKGGPLRKGAPRVLVELLDSRLQFALLQCLVLHQNQVPIIENNLHEVRDAVDVFLVEVLGTKLLSLVVAGDQKVVVQVVLFRSEDVLLREVVGSRRRLKRDT